MSDLADALEKEADEITCYASTISEHRPNGTAKLLRNAALELRSKQREVDSWRDAYEKAKEYTAELEKAKDSLRDAAIKANRKLEELSRQATIKEAT